MRKTNMSLQKYEAILRAYELNSLTKAGAELGISQSAVSHMISSVEDSFGFKILRRSRAGVKLTPDGERIIKHIRAVLNEHNALMDAAINIKGLKGGRLRIGSFSSVAVHWLPQLIKEFSGDYPDIELRLLNGDYHDVENWITEGEVDLGFISLPSDIRGKKIALYEDRLLAILPKNHTYAKEKVFPIRAVSSESFISLLQSSDHDARKALKTVGIEPNVKYETKDDYAIIAMVEQGLGISIMPELLLVGFEERNIAKLPLLPPVSRTIGLCITEGDKAGPAALKFSEYVERFIRNNYR